MRQKFKIDLSMLTPEEQQQFRDDPTTLTKGEVDVALYLRFSSERQKEQSIEGQLRDCIAYCKRKSFRIVAVYVDRATTARKDVEKRVHFQEMISDSVHHLWNFVVVWKLDRFARNREDSAVFKMRLRKNGVRVKSATETISENPEGIILESVLEGIAEYYSADLSQKITRGMRESALKGHSIGGYVPLGYKLEDHKLVINPATAHIVQEAFQLYANGESMAEICRIFNNKGYRTAKNSEFNRSSFKSMFKNVRYIGTYIYKDIEMENTIPPIIDKDLFETVQRRLSLTADAPARGKAKVDYLLSGKLFCGHCGAAMNGESGTSKTGAIHNYYACYSRKRRKGCNKKPLKKDFIEYIVARDAMALLTDDVIEELADMAMSQADRDLKENTRIPELSTRLTEVEQGINNITKAVEKGIASDALLNRLTELEKEKKDLTSQLREEEKYIYRIDRDQVVFWLTKFQGGDIEDEDFRRRIINLLVNSVTVWDEPNGYKITTAYNLTSCKTKTFRVSDNAGSPSGEGFGFGELSSTIKSREIERFRGFLQLIETLTRADFRLNLPPIGSHPLRSYTLFKPHYLTVPPVTEELLKALPVLVFAVFFSDDRKDILPAAMSVGIGFSILENTAILVQNLTVVTLGWAALRGLSASLMHGLCTMIIGAGLPYVKKQRKLFCTGIFGLFTVSATMHALFNLLIQSDYSWLGACFPMVLYVLFYVVRRTGRIRLPFLSY